MRCTPADNANTSGILSASGGSGALTAADGIQVVEAGPEQVLPVTLSVVSDEGIGGRHGIRFVVESEDGRERRVIESSFFGPTR